MDRHLEADEALQRLQEGNQRFVRHVVSLDALLSRVFVEAGARVKARQARKALTDSIAEVTAVEVVGPIQAELDRLVAAREATAKAR